MTADGLRALSDSLRVAGVDEPVLVLDLGALDHNTEVLKRHADPGLALRLVAKSLPCLPLLDYVAERLGADRFMSFSGAMLSVMLKERPDWTHLLGKPLPVSVARRVLKADPTAASKVQWLVDTPERIQQYADLASDRGTPLQLSLELDVGLHRGGFSEEGVSAAIHQIEASPGLMLSGVMGYEPHLAKMPAVLRSRAWRSFEAAYGDAVRAIGQGATELCLNTGGSLTFQTHSSDGLANDLSFGSVLVLPTDFDAAAALGFAPAAFIATPVLKVMPNNGIPGLDGLPIPRKAKTDLAIFGGNYLAKPVFPEGFDYSGVFGRSSNQEVWSGPKNADVQPGDIALLRPTQSEFVLAQFARIVAVRDGEIEKEWPCLPV